jgi:hypothetical protein
LESFRGIDIRTVIDHLITVSIIEEKQMFRPIIVLFFVSICLLSCNSLPDSAPLAVTNMSGSGRGHNSIVSVIDFPHEVGSWWVYKHQFANGYLSVGTDTITIQLIDKVDLANGTVEYIWLRMPGRIIDTVTISVNTVYTRDENLPLGNKTYVFPLFVGSRWVNHVGLQYIDSSVVTSIMTRTTGSNIFKNAFRIQSKTDSRYWYTTEDRWFVPGIGIISSSEYTMTLESYDFGGSWELLSYSIRRPH